MNTAAINTSTGTIALHQNREDGFPIVFVHGNSLSASTFSLQMNDSSLNKYRLIGFDLPGHGNSFKSSSPEKDYTPATFIKILTELCCKLNAGNGILVGHSLGGHVALDSLEYLPDVRGIATFGTTPLTIPPMFEKAFLPNPLLGLIFKPDITRDEMLQMAAGFVAEDNNIPDEIIQSIKKTDPSARLYIGKALTNGNILDEVKIITDRNIPYAVLHGEKDHLVNSEYFDILPNDRLWGSKVHFIENAGHTPQLENPKRFNEILLRFVQGIL